MTWMTWLFQRKVAWFSHSGQVFLDHGVHPIYDKNDKEATSSLKVSVISRLPCSKKDGKRFNKRALLDKGCWVGLTTWFEWMRQCRFQESAVGVFLFAKNLQSLELQLDGFRKVAFRLDRKHCFFFPSWFARWIHWFWAWGMSVGPVSRCWCRMLWMLTTPESCCNISCGTVGKAESSFMLLFFNHWSDLPHHLCEVFQKSDPFVMLIQQATPIAVSPLHMCHGLNSCSFLLVGDFWVNLDSCYILLIQEILLGIYIYI